MAGIGGSEAAALLTGCILCPKTGSCDVWSREGNGGGRRRISRLRGEVHLPCAGCNDAPVIFRQGVSGGAGSQVQHGSSAGQQVRGVGVGSGMHSDAGREGALRHGTGALRGVPAGMGSRASAER